MAIIGNFIKTEGKIIGTVLTLKLHVEATFLPVAKTSDKSPDYRASAHGVEIGAGWTKSSEGKKDCISVTLDDPSFRHPLHSDGGWRSGLRADLEPLGPWRGGHWPPRPNLN